MKRKLASFITVLALALCGCMPSEGLMGRALALRSRLTSSERCSFDLQISSDLGEQICCFAMTCQAVGNGSITFMLTEPATIAGISGTLSADGGEFSFDGTAVAFQPLADCRVTPVSAPWILIHTLCFGYITSCGQYENGIMLSVDEGYEEDGVSLYIYLGQDDLPVAAEVFWEGSRILSMRINNFAIE